MTEDVSTNVQTEIVSADTGTSSPSAGAEPLVPQDEKEGKSAKPEIQPLTPEAVSKMIADEVAKATEIARREIQSAKDRARAEVEAERRKAQLAETTLNQVRGKLKEVNPDFETELELAELRARDRQYQEAQREAQLRQQAEHFDSAFKSSLSQFIVSLGADPKDTRIDWADDAPDYLTKQSRILSSVVKIHKDEAKQAEEKRNKEIKEIEAKLRKELGLDSVDTSTPSASISDAEYLERYGRGEVNDHKRAREILNRIKGG